MNLKFMYTDRGVKGFDHNYDPKNIYEIGFDKVIKIKSNFKFFIRFMSISWELRIVFKSLWVQVTTKFGKR